MSVWGTEEREQSVAYELVNEAVEFLDRGGQLLEQFVLQRLHHLRIETLGQRGESAQIGEQDGHCAPVGLRLGQRV